jgi:hypothetical protein
MKDKSKNKANVLQDIVDKLDLVQIRVHSALNEWDVLSVYVHPNGQAIVIDIRKGK